MHDTGGEPLSANDAEKLGFGDRAKSILGLSSSGSKDRVQHPGRDELKSEVGNLSWYFCCPVRMTDLAE
jgi:hypothetical protein